MLARVLHRLDGLGRSLNADDEHGPVFMAAFEKPVKDTAGAIAALRDAADGIGKAYSLKREIAELSVPEKMGTLDDVVTVTGGFVDQVTAAIRS